MKTLRTCCAVVLLCLSAASGCLRLSGEPDELTCESTKDCEPGEACFTPEGKTEGQCLPDDYCDEAADCRFHLECKDHVCTTPKCRSPEDCGGYQCEFLSGKCEDSCGYDWECAEDYACVAGQCLPSGESECSDGAECASGYCTDGVCEEPCDCSGDTYCLDNQCIPKKSTGEACSDTTSDEECQGYCCESPNGLACADSCKLDLGQDCFEHDECYSGRCNGSTCSDECSKDADCKTFDGSTLRCGLGPSDQAMHCYQTCTDLYDCGLLSTCEGGLCVPF